MAEQRTYRYYDLVMAGFVTIVICSNLIGAGKVAEVAGFRFGAGILFFPLAYVFGDILTEVYGYARARRVVWAGFAAQLYMSVMAGVVVAMPPSADWTGQAAYEAVFGSTWRIVAASLVAFFCGEFVNSFVLAKMKLWTAGRHLWSRTIGSTVAGEAVDTLLFYPLAFYGVWSTGDLGAVMLANYALKVGWEVVLTPVTYRVVGWLKRAEQEDYFDRTTNFTPFSLRT